MTWALRGGKEGSHQNRAGRCGSRDVGGCSTRGAGKQSALPEQQSGCSVLRGRRGGRRTPPDDGEGEDREGWMLPCEPVHGCLKRAGHATQRRLAHAWCMSQVRGDPMCQRAPESRTGSAWLGPLYAKIVCSQFVCFDIFDAFRGVKNGWHGDTPCSRMLPVWGCLLRSSQYGRYWCDVGRGTVLNLVFSHLCK